MNKISSLYHRYRLEFLLILFTLATRIPFMSRYLYSWDSAQFALSLEYFDIAQHQPHPPGYVTYIFLGKILHTFIGNANTVFVTLSIVAMCVMIVLFYRLCLLLFLKSSHAFWFSLIVLCNPYIWFYSETAATYIFDGLFSTLFLYLTLLIFQKKNVHCFYLLTFFLAFASGIRQSLVIFFGLFWIAALVVLIKNKKITWKQFFITCAIGALTLYAWMLPLFYLSGGLENYWQTNSYHFLHIDQQTSIFKDATWDTVREQSLTTFKITFAALNVLLLTPVLLLFSLPKLRKTTFRKIFCRPITYLLLLQLIPAYFVYCLVHLGNAGYIMSVIIALILLFLFPLQLIKNKKVFIAVVIFILLAQTGTFLAIDSITYKNTFGSVAEKIHKMNRWYAYHSREKVQVLDNELATYISTIHNYHPQDTLLITEKGFQYRAPHSDVWVKNSHEWFRQIQYYFPEFDVYELFSGKTPTFYHTKGYSRIFIHKSPFIPIPLTTKNIIIITDNIDRDALQASGIQKIPLKSDLYLFLLDVAEKERVSYAQYTFIKIPTPSVEGTSYTDCLFCFENE